MILNSGPYLIPLQFPSLCKSPGTSAHSTKRHPALAWHRLKALTRQGGRAISFPSQHVTHWRVFNSGKIITSDTYNAHSRTRFGGWG